MHVLNKRRKLSARSLLIGEHSISVIKSSTLRIFTYDSGVEALHVKRSHCHGFCSRPIDVVGLNAFESVRDMERSQSLVHLEVIWELHGLQANIFESCLVKSCSLRFSSILTWHDALPFMSVSSASLVSWVHCRLQRRNICLALFKLAFEMIVNLFN